MRKMRRWILLFLMSWMLCIGVCAQNLAVERQIYDYLTEELGLPSSAACGVLANIEMESAFNIHALGDEGTSYGICQWHAGRYTMLKNYCTGKGLNHQTLPGQLAYLKYELQTSYQELLGALRIMEQSPQGAYRAAYLWCVEFERPAQMEQKAATRGALASGKYWNRYNCLVMIEQETILPEQELLQIVEEFEVQIPKPPEPVVQQEPTQEQPEQEEQVQSRPGIDISQLIRPVAPVRPVAKVWHGNPATGFAVALLFMPVSDGKKSPYFLPEPQQEEIESK